MVDLNSPREEIVAAWLARLRDPKSKQAHGQLRKGDGFCCLGCGSHFVIDRWRLARFVVWLKNGPWHPLTATGYQDDVPPWLAVWLLIFADNTIHLICNGLAIWAVSP